MQVLDAITARRSIRKYKEEEISKEQIIDILNCGRLAPSAKNRQPWFFVVTSGEKKDGIANMMKEAAHCENGVRSSVEATANVMLNAPIVVFIFKEEDEVWDIGDNLSIGASIENMCLRAVELGLGTLWIRDTYAVETNIAKYLNQNDKVLSCALAIGVPSGDIKERPRKTLDEVVEWYL